VGSGGRRANGGGRRAKKQGAVRGRAYFKKHAQDGRGVKRPAERAGEFLLGGAQPRPLRFVDLGWVRVIGRGVPEGLFLGLGRGR
jgi:hypothetical protein